MGYSPFLGMPPTRGGYRMEALLCVLHQGSDEENVPGRETVNRLGVPELSEPPPPGSQRGPPISWGRFEEPIRRHRYLSFET